MSEAAEADPVVICVGSDHFRAHTGAAWRAVADGAIVRVSDRRSGEVLGWLMRRTPHELADRIWQLPDSHEAADDQAALDERPELPAEPSAWIVAPEPEAEVA